MAENDEIETGAFAQFIGIHLVHAAEGESTVELNVTENILNRSHVTHGGAVFTLADMGMARAMRSLFGEKKYAATTGATIHYFEPAKADVLVCKARVIHQGRRSATAEASVYANEILVAKATGTYVVREKRLSEK